jgi:hypothetical protein
MVKLTVKVALKENQWTFMIKILERILDTNFKLIKDGNISVLYIQNTMMCLKFEKEPYLFVLSNIDNK